MPLQIVTKFIMLFLYQPKVIRKKIRKIHRRKINKLCKDHKKSDMFITPYCRGDEMNQRKFSSLEMFNIMVMWWLSFNTTFTKKK